MNHFDLPTIKDLPKDGSMDGIAEYSERTIGRSWVEAFKIGHWGKDEIYSMDLQCYSDDTECLTINGWKYIKDLLIGELIMGFNPSTNSCCFQAVEYLNINEYEGLMYSLQKEKCDLLITPNHRVILKNHVRSKSSSLYKKNKYEHWKTYKALDMPNGNFKIPVSYHIEDRPDYDISDAMLRIIAWINTEGWIKKCKGRNYGINICQSSKNKEECKEIAQSLINASIPYNEYSNMRIYHHTDKLNNTYSKIQFDYRWYISVDNSNNYIYPYLDENNIHFFPMWILQYCSLRQLRLYFDTLIKGDGSISIKHKRVIKLSFYSNLKENADRMMYLCHLLGYNINIIPPNKHHTTFQMFISNDGRKCVHDQSIQYGDVHTIYYKGNVVCPTIKDGYLVIRRNYKSCICGNSAYPSVASTLYHYRYSKITQSDKIPDDTDWGIMIGKVTVYDDTKVSPIMYRTEDGATINPNGTWDKEGNGEDYVLTLDEYKWLRKWNRGEFKPYNGYFIKYWSKIQPLYVPMQRLFNQRGISPLAKMLAKRQAAGVSGKIIQHTDDGKVGRWYNPIWGGGMIRTLTRLNVADFIYENNLQDYIVHIGTDGILSEKNVAIPKVTKMGAWKLNEQEPAIVVSSGNVYFGNKKPHGLTYSDIIELIGYNPKSSYYHKPTEHRQTLGESLKLDDFEHLGDMKEWQSSLDLTSLKLETDRIFPNFPKTGKDLLENKYNSHPIFIER